MPCSNRNSEGNLVDKKVDTKPPLHVTGEKAECHGPTTLIRTPGYDDTGVTRLSCLLPECTQVMYLTLQEHLSGYSLLIIGHRRI